MSSFFRKTAGGNTPERPRADARRFERGDRSTTSNNNTPLTVAGSTHTSQNGSVENHSLQQEHHKQRTPQISSKKAHPMQMMALYQSPTVDTLDESHMNSQGAQSTTNSSSLYDSYYNKAHRLHDWNTPSSNNSSEFSSYSNPNSNNNFNHSNSLHYMPRKLISHPSRSNQKKQDHQSVPRSLTPPSSRKLLSSYQTPSPKSAANISDRSATRRSQQKQRQLKSKRRRRSGDFQVEQDSLSVQVRSVNVAARTAFASTQQQEVDSHLPSIQAWHHAASQQDEKKKVSIRKRLSPSLQHLQLLHHITSIQNIRQLSFSPSLGLNAEIFSIKDRFSRRRKRHNKDYPIGNNIGRTYKSIDPLKATLQVLPDVPPLLSNRKHRLPIRSDVGFSNPTKEEVQLKQQEIRWETQWEEASPRLIVLMTSDHCLSKDFTSNHTLPASPHQNSNHTTLNGINSTSSFKSLDDQYVRMNGGGWSGMPYAGKELVEAKQRNIQQFKMKRKSQQNDTEPKTLGLQDDNTDEADSDSQDDDSLIKGNRMSVLAPPLGAIPSSTSLGWRPRPFYDRPPHYKYCMAWPMGGLESLLLESEPLVCSLALYSIDTKTGGGGGGLYGKISEEYYFPAGDWTGKVNHVMAPGQRRRQKALFCYDPLLWSDQANGDQSLHLVMQIYKIPLEDDFLDEEFTGATATSSSSGKRSFRHRIKRKLGKIGGRSSSNINNSDKVDNEQTTVTMEDMYKRFGTQLLTPCYQGVIPFSPIESGGIKDENLQWPQGMLQTMKCHPVPAQIFDSDEGWLDHLASQAWNDAYESQTSTTQQTSTTVHTDAEATELDLETESSSGTSSKKRLFKSLRPSSKSTSTIGSIPEDGASVFTTSVIKNRVTVTMDVFTSFVEADFTKVLLQEPVATQEMPVLLDEAQGTSRLLVDSSGDCAIATKKGAISNDGMSTNSETTPARKRSDLVRLPHKTGISGYVGGAEVQEIQFLPPRRSKQYDIDVPASFRSHENFLYIYPRFLKTVAENENNSKMPALQHSTNRITIRLRLLRMTGGSTLNTENEHPTTNAMSLIPAFYNRCPWLGSPLLKEVFTKISSFSATNEGVPFRDELKLRLPVIIDGTYYLHFTLMNLTWNSPSEQLQTISETMIPLSSSSTREASSGVRVTTVIPNGAHRLKFGNHQLHLETRLVSSIHVADPTTATALRDFPLETGYMDERFKELALTPSKSIVGKSHSSDPIVDLKVSFRQLFSIASESTLLAQLPLFLLVHMSNLVNYASKENFKVTNFAIDVPEESEAGREDLKFLFETMSSLFEILRRVKAKLLSKQPLENALDRCDILLKDLVDSFDEATLLREGNGDELQREQSAEMSKTSEQAGEFTFEKTRSETSFVDKTYGTASKDESQDLEERDDNDGGASHLRHKDSVRAEIDQRIARTASRVNTSGAPFSRVAYGATRTDRMRAEAELYLETGNFTQLYDDDETTIATMFASTPKDGGGSVAWGDFEELASLADITVAELVAKKKNRESESTAANGNAPATIESSFVRRVRTAAQVIMAPCMAPSAVSSLITRRVGSPRQIKLSPHKKKNISTKKLALENASLRGISPELTIEGSDAEDEEPTNGEKKATASHGLDGVVQYRAESHCTIIQFSFSPDGRVLPRPFAYEAVLCLWFKSWVEYRSKVASFDKALAPISFPPLYLGIAQLEGCQVYEFYSHMDLLLPLCLKSIVLRCSPHLSSLSLRHRCIFDADHMKILYPLTGALAASILGEAISSQGDNPLASALHSTDVLFDFLFGLASIIHAQQLAELLEKYFSVMRDLETLFPPTNGMFVWNKEALKRVSRCRQLSLRAVERCSTVGAFLALNFPMKYQDWKPRSRRREQSWTDQSRPDSTSSEAQSSKKNPPSIERLPKSGWLAELVLTESLRICSHSCETVVAEAMAHIEISQDRKVKVSPELDRRPGKSLTKEDFLMFHSTAVHAITCAHELILRRHALDARFQTEKCRGRIALVFAKTMLEQSMLSVRWLARMESTHKVRTLWLICFTYILQEAPEVILRSAFQSYCQPPDFSILHLIRLLRLSSSTFQALLDQSVTCDQALDKSLSPWLLQESFNSICASMIMVLDECTGLIGRDLQQSRLVAKGTLDLLLHVLTVPQSAVTHLRTVGGALQALESFGIEIFLEVTGENLQHWLRIMLTLMNTVSLSVRSIAVDFMISLLGDTFSSRGSIDDITVVVATVLPEVVAREIALYSVSGLVQDFEHIERVVWPLRRALADIEGANPLDDDRVDPQLAPVLSVFCRGCQAIIDGVTLELRLQESVTIIGSRINADPRKSRVFDADEESLFEASCFFSSEVSQMQRLRWLRTLKRLHESKGQWIEAAETLMMCARSITDSLLHLQNVWTPSEFVLWNDTRRSLWLGTIGQDLGLPTRGNLQVMEFASSFLQPPILFGEKSRKDESGKLVPPSIVSMCKMLLSVVREAIDLFLKESGTTELAFSRLESLLRVLSSVIEEHGGRRRDRSLLHNFALRAKLAQEATELRRVSAFLNSDLNKLAAKLLSCESVDAATVEDAMQSALRRQHFVRVALSGAKPERFYDNTALPSFFDWESPCICRVPRRILETVLSDNQTLTKSAFNDRICEEYGRSIHEALALEKGSVVFRCGSRANDTVDDPSVTYLNILAVHRDLLSINTGDTEFQQGHSYLEAKRFFYRKASTSSSPRGTRARGQVLINERLASNLVELTVARPFPCPLSRQRTLITSEFVESSA